MLDQWVQSLITLWMVLTLVITRIVTQNEECNFVFNWSAGTFFSLKSTNYFTTTLMQNEAFTAFLMDFFCSILKV